MYRTTHRRPRGTQKLTAIRQRGWSGRIASLPLFFLSSLPMPQVALCVRSGPMTAQNASFRARFASWRISYRHNVMLCAYSLFLIPCGIQSWHRAVFWLHAKYFNIVLYRILSLELWLSLNWSTSEPMGNYSLLRLLLAFMSLQQRASIWLSVKRKLQEMHM